MDKKIIDPAQCTVEGYLERIGYELAMKDIWITAIKPWLPYRRLI